MQKGWLFWPGKLRFKAMLPIRDCFPLPPNSDLRAPSGHGGMGQHTMLNEMGSVQVLGFAALEPRS